MRAVAVVMLVLLGFCGTNHALETQLDLVGKLGLELYAQHHIGELGDD